MSDKPNPTRTPLNDVQITELRMAADKAMGSYHRQLLDRLIGEHKRLTYERTELVSLNLWSARRLQDVHRKRFAHDELESITDERHERL